MKKVVLIVFIAVNTVLSSCKNDDNIVNITKLPKSITSASANLSFSYSNSGQLVKITDRYSSTEYSETLFTYDSDGKLAKFVNVYSEEGSVLTESFTVSYPTTSQAKVTDEDNEYTLVNFNEQGQVVSFDNAGSITAFLYDANDNVVKTENDNTTNTASYNNDKGIFNGITSPKWVLLLNDFDLYYFAANNPVSVNKVSIYNGTSYTYSETYNYPIEHIIDGYPTRMSVNYTENGSTDNEVFIINY